MNSINKCFFGLRFMFYVTPEVFPFAYEALRVLSFSYYVNRDT